MHAEGIRAGAREQRALGRAVREIRARRGWSQEFLGFAAGLHRNYVGSVIINETNRRYYEPSPRRNMTVGIQAALQF